MAIDRNELIDFLLRRDFGSLPPRVPRGKTPLDQMLDEARRKRDLSMAGLEDPGPAIERRRSEYEALSDESLLSRYNAANEQDEKQAESHRRHVDAVRAGAWPRWARKDLWSEEEFATLCCGIIPNERGMHADPGRTQDDSVLILQANDDIRRGTLSGTLEFVPRSDNDAASRLYGESRHYRPLVAVEWAIARFERFPKELADAVRKNQLGSWGSGSESKEQGGKRIDSTMEESIDPRERVTMLRLIRALSKMANLPEKGSAVAISKQLAELGFMKPGEATIRNLIKESRNLEPEKPQ